MAVSKTKIAMASLSPSHFRPRSLASFSSSSSRLSPNPPDLIEWVRKEGGFVHQALKIAPDSDNGGLGLVSSDHIPKGSELVVLPHNIPLRFDSDEADSVLLHLARQVPEEMWSMKLGLKLLKERAKVGSFWWPYIGNLPKVFNVPIFFPHEDMENLQSASLIYQVRKRCCFLHDFEQEVKRTLDYVKPEDHPFGGQAVKASSLGWAMAAVSSRAFRLYGKKLSDGPCNSVPILLPLIDMCNHNFNPKARIVQVQDAGSMELKVKVVAETEIEENVPLTLNYACLDNDRFLLDYGFVIPSNPYDYFEIDYVVPMLEAARVLAGVSSENISYPAHWQKVILSKLNLYREAAIPKVRIGGQEVVDGRLLAAIRVLLSDDEEMVRKLDLDVLKSLSAEAPLGVTNEVEALRTIIWVCMTALGLGQHSPSTITNIEKDEALLKVCATDSTKLALQYRIQKKSLILAVMINLARRVGFSPPPVVMMEKGKQKYDGDGY